MVLELHYLTVFILNRTCKQLVRKTLTHIQFVLIYPKLLLRYGIKDFCTNLKLLKLQLHI